MLEAGTVFRLSSRVRRLVAPNPGAMTGPGTNTYLIGDNEVTVLDPGPAIAEHVDAILAAGAGRIRRIVCTHTHPDHSPAWQALAEATNAEVIGPQPGGDDHQDETFTPDVIPADDAVFAFGDATLRALHTPGHVGNHFCYLLEEEGLLFAGDHVMNGSTVVIIPPGGDMQAYIASLERLLAYPIRAIAPGHGDIIEDSDAEVRRLVAHRLGREEKVLAGLARSGGGSLDELVAIVYDDVDPALHPWAKKSLEAHLIKLDREGRARCNEKRWSALD
jgi:glyoxylase-like metal-dependent hydrolase (beta-lactamase superfamily II)